MRALYFFYFFAVIYKQQNERPHSAYLGERELLRPMLEHIFSNFEAVLPFLFGVSLTEMDKLDEYKFLQA